LILTNCVRLTRRNLTGNWYREVPSQHIDRAILTDHTATRSTRFAAGSPTSPAHEVLYLCENDIQLSFETHRTYGKITQPSTVVSVPGRDAHTTVTAGVYLTNIADLTDPQQADLIATNAQELTGDWEVYPRRTSPPGSLSTTHTGIAPTQQLGQELFNSGFLGLITFSAAIADFKNLVVFPQRLAGSECSITYTWTERSGQQRYLKIP
jgi:hypothetical protein